MTILKEKLEELLRLERVTPATYKHLQSKIERVEHEISTLESHLVNLKDPPRQSPTPEELWEIWSPDAIATEGTTQIAHHLLTKLERRLLEGGYENHGATHVVTTWKNEYKPGRSE